MNKRLTPANDNASLHYLSVCAGIEAASVAWHPLGWRACLLSEIEKFPRRVLAHHYPTVGQWGDFTALRVRHLKRLGIPLPAILVGGTPCQAFSVAGARRSLQDARGNLTLSFVRLAHALANTGSLRNVVWENVPGVLSTKDNAFGCFLGALVGGDAAIQPPGGRSWPDSGMVAGPKGRAAWTIKDAQYFGLAQRRRRVFVVADFGNGADPAAVLFEPVSLLGNFAPRREAGQGVAAAITASAGGVSGKDDIGGRVAAVLRGHSDYGNGTPSLRAKGGDVGGGSEALVYAPEISRCVATKEGSSQDYETTTMVVGAICKDSFSGGAGGRPEGAAVGHFIPVAQCITGEVTHTLRADGFDASEDGTGRGTPIAFDPRQTDVPVTGDITGTLDASFPGPAICFSAKDSGGDAMVELSPTLRAGGHAGSHANAGVMPAVTVALRGRDGGATAELGGEVATSLRASSGGGDKAHVLASAVRRLTPLECERLQGFPDYYTKLPGYDADGPRYRALGNSMAVPVMAWIGERIAANLPVNSNEAPGYVAEVAA